jgi:hypothetical protein
MIIIHEDGRVERDVPHVDYTSITKAVNPPGRDDPFTTVPLPEGMACGYTMWANDVGLLIGLRENLGAQMLASYAPLVGPVCVTTFEESGDEELLGEVTPLAKANFETRLNEFLRYADDLAARRAAPVN